MHIDIGRKIGNSENVSPEVFRLNTRDSIKEFSPALAERSAMMASFMEPMLPKVTPELEELAFQLTAESSRYTAQVNPLLQRSVGELMRKRCADHTSVA